MSRARLFVLLALRNVFRNRTRTLFALGTIATGAMGLWLFMGFNAGLMNQYRANTIRARWGHGEVSLRGYRDGAHAHPWEHWIEDPKAVQARLMSLPGVEDTFPRVRLAAMLLHDGRTLIGLGEGIDGLAEARFFTQLNYVAGGDLGGDAEGVVLGRGLARGLAVEVGDEVDIAVRNVRGESNLGEVRVVGIFHTGIQDFDDIAFRVPLGLAQELLETDRVERIALALTGIDAWPGVAQAVSAELPALEAVPFDVLDEVWYRHAVDWLEAQFQFIRAIILLVVFLSVFNVVSLTVAERTVEIGTLRANGESRAEIITGQVLEALTLGVLGAVIGLAAGWLLTAGPLASGVAMPPAPGLTRSFRIVIELAFGDALRVLVLSAATAVAGCLWPAWRAATMPIAHALRGA